jgi:hypothetical protein
MSEQELTVVVQTWQNGAISREPMPHLFHSRGDLSIFWRS